MKSPKNGRLNFNFGTLKTSQFSLVIKSKMLKKPFLVILPLRKSQSDLKLKHASNRLLKLNHNC